MASPNPDDLQRQAANPFESAWVAASAGSGKTKVLSDRVLNLLLTGTPPEKILCLTFTRTAAAQMANKIADRLAKWAAEDEADLVADLTKLRAAAPDDRLIARARRLFARLLDTAGGLKVTTLHGFCQSVLKRFPLEAGVSPQFDVLDERAAKDLIEQAQNKILGQPQFADCLKTVTAATNEDGFLGVLTEMTAHLPEIDRIKTRFPTAQALTRAYEQALNLPENCTIESLTDEFCALSDERTADLRQAVTVLNASHKKTDKDNAARIGAFLAADNALRHKLLDDYSEVFLTKTGTIRERLVCKEAQSVTPAMMSEAVRAQTCREQMTSRTVMDLSLALFALASAILNEYTAMKEERGVMDYDDLIAATRRLLEKSGATAWVLYKLDGGVDHILVDEAQDTSPDQWAIIRALAGEFFAGKGQRQQERTIFAVGDKKQSIFSFQGAVPEEFERMRAFFKTAVENAGKKWNDVPMYISFRSVQAVIDIVNFVLQFAPARLGVTDDSEDATHVSFRKKQAGLVEIWPTETPQSGDTEKPFTKPVERVFAQTPSARLAHKIALKIADMIFSGERLESENRPIRAGDIMILMRRRSAFINDLSRELKSMGVAVSGIDRLKIATHIAVKDLMVLGDFLLLPENDQALATVLRSPLCGTSPDDLSDKNREEAARAGVPLNGIGENDLFRLACDRGEQTLFDRLKRHEGEPTPLGEAYAFLKDLLNRVDNMRPYELYAYVLGTLGRRRNFVARLGVQALDALDEFMNLALDFDSVEAPSLQNFLCRLRQNDVEIKRDPEQSFDAVRIMTVHAAKGLQAPVVFLPDTRPARFHCPKTFWPDDGNGELCLWVPKKGDRNDIVNAEIESLQEKDADEYRRLLYVALTRAADRLYITGWESRNNGDGGWYDLIRGAVRIENADGSVSYRMQQVKTPLFDEPVLRLTCAQEQPPAPVAEQSAAKTAAPLPDWVFRAPPAEPTPPKPLAPSRPDVAEPAALSPLSAGRLQAIKRGTAVHTLLEILPRYPAADRESVAKKLTADLPDRDELIARVQALLDAPLAAGLFTPDSLAEVPVSGVIGDRVVNGKIDRMAVLESEVLLIDYKSGRRVPADVNDTPAAYIAQMAAYKKLIGQIYPDKTVRCFLLWTEAPELVEITRPVDTMEY